MRPSCEQVLNGYKEYVHLHKIQSSAVTAFSDANGQEQIVDETIYKQVAEILRNGEVQTIAENLFSAFDEYEPDAEIRLDADLRSEIRQAIKHTYTEWIKVHARCPRVLWTSLQIGIEW